MNSVAVRVETLHYRGNVVLQHFLFTILVQTLQNNSVVPKRGPFIDISMLIYIPSAYNCE